MALPRIRGAGLPMAVGIACATAAHGQTAPAGPLSVEAVVSARQFLPGARVQLSPDAERVVYVLQDPRRRAALVGPTESGLTRSGVRTRVVGSDVWIADTGSGETQSLTGGQGTSWGASWSPSGADLAFYSDRGGTAQLWAWNRAAGSLRRVSTAIVHPYGAAEIPQWTPDGRMLLVKLVPEERSIAELAEPTVSAALRAEGASKVHVYRSPARSEPDAPILAGDADLARASAGVLVRRADLALVEVATGRVERLVRDVPIAGYWISPRGDQIAYTVWHPPSQNSQLSVIDLHVVSLDDGTARRLVAGVPQVVGASVSWSPDGTRLAYTTSGIDIAAAPAAGIGDCYVVAAAGGAPINVTPDRRAPLGDFRRAPVWDSDGESLYFTSRDTLWRVPVRASGMEPVAALAGRRLVSVVGPNRGGRLWSPDGERSVYVRTVDPASQKVGIAEVDVASGETSIVFEEHAAFGDPAGEVFSTDAVASTVVYLAEDARHPPDLWITSDGFANRRRLTDVNPGLRRDSRGEARIVEWQSADGRPLRGSLLLPAGYEAGRRYPLIVHVYGGAAGSARAHRYGLGLSTGNAQLFATRGYAVLDPDVPLTIGTPMLDIAKAVLPGVSRIVELGIADPDRVGVMGTSYGGYSTLALLVQTDRFRAAVSIAGASNLISDYGVISVSADRTAWAEKGQGRMGGSPWTHRERYIENSPWFYLDRVTTPILLIHGESDSGLSAARSDEMFVALRRLGREVEYARYVGMGHDPLGSGIENSSDYLHRLLDWFERHLGAAGGSAGPGAAR